MAKLKRWKFSDGRFCGWAHWCPACEEAHEYYVDLPTGKGDQWTFNGNQEKPTFSPSMNISWGYMVDGIAPETKAYYEQRRNGGRCHYNIDDGVITYHGDCTHAMKGQKVPLPDLPGGEEIVE